MGDVDGWSSLTLLEAVRVGDDAAADEVFSRYFKRLTALARANLSARLASRVDPEDIALSAYRSFFVAARDGRYTLTRGGDLWRLLAAISRHKLLKRVRHETADRRSVDAEVAFPFGEAQKATDPGPEEALALADELQRVFATLDADGRRVLELRLQGHRHAEIAHETGRSERTVRRVLAQVRDLLAGRLDAR